MNLSRAILSLILVGQALQMAGQPPCSNSLPNIQCLSTQETRSLDPSQTVHFLVLAFNEKKLSNFEGLKAENICPLTSLSDNAFICAVPNSALTKVSQLENVCCVGRIQPQAKIHKDLWNLSQDPSAKLVPVWMTVYQEMPLEIAVRTLNSFRTEILRVHEEAHMIEMLVPAANLLRLASLNWVSFLEKTPSIQGWATENSNFGGAIQGGASMQFSSLDTSFQGQGIRIALGDDGFVGPHIDFKGRLQHKDNIEIDFQGIHADLMSGIIIGSGNLDPAYRGMAPAAQLEVLNNLEAITTGESLHQDNQVALTCTALYDGCNRGYSGLAALADRQMNENPQFLHVFSAGNMGNEDCDFGAGTGWGTITGGVKTAKNGLVVGQTQASGQISPNSSRGPTSDGRLKPDIVVLGTDIPTTGPNQSYSHITGTSPAAALITGGLAQLEEAFLKEINADEPICAALLKAVVLNTTKDIGLPGPDYETGWGVPQLDEAWQVLSNQQFWADSLSDGGQMEYALTIPSGLTELRIMVYWADKEGSPIIPKNLVNDIDLKILGPNNETHLPLVLDPSPSALNAGMSAVQGVDSINNVEQVKLLAPTAGTYQILLKGKNVPFGPQAFIVTYQLVEPKIRLVFPNEGGSWVPGEQLPIHWQNVGLPDSVELFYALDDPSSWIPLYTASPQAISHLWTLPDNAAKKIWIKIQAGDQSSISEKPILIYPTVQGLKVEKVCAQATHLQWEALDDAVEYQVYQLGAFYMDPVATISDTFVEIPVSNIFENHWFAVQAIFPDGSTNRRCEAISDGIGLLNCVPDFDLEIFGLSNPISTLFFDCFTPSISVEVNFRNNGTQNLPGFNFWYQIGEDLPKNMHFPGPVPQNLSFSVVHDSLLAFPSIGSYTLKVWHDLDIDEIHRNDTILVKLVYAPGEEADLPFVTNFDDWNACLATDDCVMTCALDYGWHNEENGFADDTDWRPHSGSTPTLNTGPLHDQNKPTAGGKYLYLEGSNNCYQKSANLLSPCINLETALEPRLSFWYNMHGLNIGSLQLDIFDGNEWHYNVMLPILGDQGQEWKNQQVDLSSFAGSLIILRFRGETGAGYLSDLALDNISVYDVAQPPLASFIAGKGEACPGTPISFKDNSLNEPLTWLWEFSPPNAIFVDGTTASSPNPIVLFTEPGTYELSLTVSNSYGSDVLVLPNWINVSHGHPLPHQLNFEDAGILDNWSITNPDNDVTWAMTETVGSVGEYTHCYFVNNHQYFASGQQDQLRSPVLNLEQASQPILRFDLAYTAYTASYADRLIVVVSDDCGNTFPYVLFDEIGQDLASSGFQTISWEPVFSSDWRQVEIDLSAFAGSSISLSFINECGFGNNLYLDNILIAEKSDLPIAKFSIQPEISSCVNEPLSLNRVSGGTASPLDVSWTIRHNQETLDTNTLDLSWTFIPQYQGWYTAQMTFFNDLGAHKQSHSVYIVDHPNSGFHYTNQQQEISFEGLSAPFTDHWWSFGDGSTSKEVNPVHDYEEGGNYQVIHISRNACGQDTTKKIVMAFASGTTGILDEKLQLELAPNPARAATWLWINGSLPGHQLQYEMLDLNGRLIQKGENVMTGLNSDKIQIDLEHIPQGVYILSVQIADQHHLLKLVLQ